MGTTYAIKTVAVPAGVTRQSLQAEVDAILGRIDRIFSIYRADSEISGFNRSVSTGWQPATSDLVAVVEAAKGMSRLSGGAFDVTTGPLAALWGFDALPGSERVPAATEIAAMRSRVGHRKLQYRHAPPGLRKRAGDIQLDPNALVAGYAADRVASRFEQLGIRNYLVDMGGEFRLKGRNAQGRAWTIAVEEPLPDARRSGLVMELTDCAVSTSGTYRNYFEVEGRRYSHVLDARSGRPVRHDLASVTVIAPTAMQADGWATMLLILGEAEGHTLAERERVAAVFMTRRGDGFRKRPSTAFAAYPVRQVDRPRMASPPPE